MKLLNLTKQSNQSFVNVMLALSLFGFLWPHNANSAGKHHHTNFIQKNDDWENGWYTPPRSPGFHDDFGA